MRAGGELGHGEGGDRHLGGQGRRVDPFQFTIWFGIVVTAYFWWNNVKGIHESSSKALRIMQITTVMFVMFLGWCVLGEMDAAAGRVPARLAQRRS